MGKGPLWLPLNPMIHQGRAGMARPFCVRKSG